MGKPYIAKVSKSNKNLMLNDRVLIPDSDFLIAVEYYFKSLLEEGSESIEVKDANGNLIYTVDFNPSHEK